MKNGNWVPMSKAYIKFLPKSREYTKLEAGFSVQVDYDCNNTVTVAGYSALWMWSRKRVSKFLEDISAEIIYPESTKKKQNQKGQIGLQIRNRSGVDKAQIRCIDSKHLQEQKNGSGTDQEQIKSRSGSTTKEPKTFNLKNTISVPLKDGTFFIPENDYLEILKTTYKNIDINLEFNKMITWCVSNPDKQKIKRGAKKFINGWMNRADVKVAPVSSTDLSTESWF